MEEKSPFVVIFIVGIIGAVFVLIFFLPFFYGTPKAPEKGEVTATTIPVEHQYQNGLHLYTGSIETPTPCHALRSESNAAPNQVTLVFETINTSKNCTKAVTTQTFIVSFIAPENARIEATLDGELAGLVN